MQVAFAVMPVQRTHVGTLLHVQQHGAGPEAALAVAAAIVEAHAGLGVRHAAEQTAIKAAVGLGLELEDAAFHAGDPALAAAGDAGQHLVALPDLVLAIGRLPAVQLAGGNVDPVQGLFAGVPHGAFAGAVAGVDDQFTVHGRASWRAWVQLNGPATAKAPPW
ncbi:hypothetical protein D3C76_1058490 [compost metagenome]